MNYICKLDLIDVWWCLFGLCNMKGFCQCVPSLLAKHQMLLKIKHDFVGHSRVEMHGEVTKRREKRKRPGTHGCMYLKLLQTPNMRRCIILNYLCGSQYVSVWSIHPRSVWGCFCWGLTIKMTYFVFTGDKSGIHTGSIHLKIIKPNIAGTTIDLWYDMQYSHCISILFPWYPHSTTTI